MSEEAEAVGEGAEWGEGEIKEGELAEGEEMVGEGEEEEITGPSDETQLGEVIYPEAEFEEEGVGEPPSKEPSKEAPKVPPKVEKEKEPEKMAEPPSKKLSVIYGMEIKAPEIIKVIKAHKPSATFNHSPDMVCCLSLKTYAVWLLDLTHNAHNWTKWMHAVVYKIGQFAAIVKGDVVGPDGKKKVLYKQEWRDFCKEITEMIAAWQKYSAQVRKLTKDILEDIRGKEVKCCPQCLKARRLTPFSCMVE